MFIKRRLPSKTGWVLISLFLCVSTVQVLYAVGVFCSDKHLKTGLNCDCCHGTTKVTSGAGIGMTKCLSCHESYEKLAKRTEKMRLNPHVDYHLGVLDCTVCHHGHKADENHCLSCHKEDC